MVSCSTTHAHHCLHCPCPMMRCFRILCGTRSPPGGPSCLWTHTGGPRPLVDWMGINYYSRMVLGADLEPACYPGETLSTMGYALHAPGILEVGSCCSGELVNCVLLLLVVCVCLQYSRLLLCVVVVCVLAV